MPICSCEQCANIRDRLDTEESTGYVLVRYYGKDHWNNYKFFQKGKFKGYHGNWMDDPIEATVFGNAYFDRAVSDIQLICHPNYNYKFVPVNVRSTKEISWKRTYIAQSNTND